MTLKDVLTVASRNLLLGLLCILVGVAGAASYALFVPPKYEASARLYVYSDSATNTSDLSLGSTYAQQVVKSYAALATSPLVLGEVVRNRNLRLTADKAANNVVVSVPLDTVILNIQASSVSPRGAAELANGVADQLPLTVQSLSPTSSSTSARVRISQIARAEVPVSGSGPSLPVLLVVGLILGFVLAVAVVALRSLLDTRVRDASQASELLGLPVLGAVERRAASEIVFDNPAASGRWREQFRALRTNLQYLSADRPLRSVVLTSASPKEGKSTSSVALAQSLATAGRRVLLIDADLRRPSVGRLLGVEASLGLSDLLANSVKSDQVIQQWGGISLDVLPAGPPPPNPSELLQSAHMAELLHEFENRYDIVVLDTPPLLGVTDAAILAAIASGAMLVVNVSRIRAPDARSAMQLLNGVGARTLGLLVTMTSPTRRGGYADYNTSAAASKRTSLA